MIIMKTKLLLSASAATLMASGSLFAQDAGPKAINTGGDKGAYHTLFCPPLPPALSNAYFPGYKCTPSRGTLENIDRGIKYPTSVGFVQLDMFAYEAVKRAEEFKKLAVIRSDIACEGLWMVTKNPDLTNFGHILGLARRIPFIVDISNNLFAAVQSFRLERGAVTHALDIVGQADDADLHEIEMQRALADSALNSGLAKLPAARIKGTKSKLTEISESRNLQIALRRETDAALGERNERNSARLGANWIAANARLVRAIDELASLLDEEFNDGDPFIAKMMQLKRIAGLLRTDSGADWHSGAC